MRKRRISQCAAIILAGVMLCSGCGELARKSIDESSAEVMVDMNDGAMYSTEAGAATDESSSLVYQENEQPIEFNTEEYHTVEESGFLSAATNPLSTFAADVDTASYANLRRMILDGRQVDKGAVRIEEMINYFHYDYKEPKSDEPFSVTTEIAPCPWNEESELLLVGLQAEKMNPQEIPPSNLVFLVDVSGSMSDPDKLPLVQQAFRLLCENLKSEDRISIVTYASYDEVVLNGASGEETGKIIDAIESLQAGGGTSGAAGIQTAYEIAARNYIDGGNNRVILATDGDLNIGISSESELTALIKEKAKSDVDLSVMGFGTGNIKDNKMEALADNGNGNYSYIDTLAEARKVLFEEMDATLFTVAKDVKFQVEFNPAVVAEYRQIGYENRQMADRDFADDTKDGGEIGAGHRVTVLYEIKKADDGTGENKIDLKYQETKTTDSTEWLTVNIRYKEPSANESKLLTYPVGQEAYTEEMTDNLRFASCVAQTGMLLRESEYIGQSSYSSVLEQLSRIDGLNQDDYKEEFRYLVKKLV